MKEVSKEVSKEEIDKFLEVHGVSKWAAFKLGENGTLEIESISLNMLIQKALKELK